MDQATRYRWLEMPQDHPMPLIDRRRIVGEHAMIAEVCLHKGFQLATHHHENEQFAIVLSGKMRFIIGAADSPDQFERVLEAGEVLHLPPNVPHAAEALEQSVLLDVFSPPSEKTGVDG